MKRTRTTWKTMVLAWMTFHEATPSSSLVQVHRATSSKYALSLLSSSQLDYRSRFSHTWKSEGSRFRRPSEYSTRPHHRRSLTAAAAKPMRRGSVVESYQTVSVNCAKCRERLFRYKKKNGTKSNLVKCFVERIVSDDSDDDPDTVLRGLQVRDTEDENVMTDAPIVYQCPKCQTHFARLARIRGLPALKLIGGKTRMAKK